MTLLPILITAIKIIFVAVNAIYHKINLHTLFGRSWKVSNKRQKSRKIWLTHKMLFWINVCMSVIIKIIKLQSTQFSKEIIRKSAWNKLHPNHIKFFHRHYLVFFLKSTIIKSTIFANHYYINNSEWCPDFK